MLFQFPAGEASKTRETWYQLTDQMLKAGYGRDAAVVALGGGVVGDLAGFLAATYLRGVPYVQVPTSLLAMIDSSVGGKTGIDTDQGKNLVGAFHQPAVVVADLATLTSLPAAHVSAGMAEAVKHGVIANAQYLSELVADSDKILDGEPEALFRTVKGSVEIKAAVVSEDERESGKRATLNFGHTVAHALEAATEFRLLHGEAVAAGMLAEADLGVAMGITSCNVPKTILEALRSMRLPSEARTGKTEGDLLALVRQDKKGRRNAVRFALPVTVGSMAPSEDGSWTHAAPESAITGVLSRFS